MDMNLIKLSVHNDQEAFDAAVRHLSHQKARAWSAEGQGSCVYSTEDEKTRCVVGALLVLDTPDKRSWAKMVRASIKDIVKGGRSRSRYAIDQNGVSVPLLQRLQEQHDLSGNWRDFGFAGWDELRVIARQFGLNAKVLDAYGR